MKRTRDELLFCVGVGLWVAVMILTWPRALSFRDEVGYLGRAKLLVEGHLGWFANSPGVWVSTTRGMVGKYPLFQSLLLAALAARDVRARRPRGARAGRDGARHLEELGQESSLGVARARASHRRHPRPHDDGRSAAGDGRAGGLVGAQARPRLRDGGVARDPHGAQADGRRPRAGRRRGRSPVQSAGPARA